VRGKHTVDLSWSGTTSAEVDIYRDGVVIATPSNSGFYTDSIGVRGATMGSGEEKSEKAKKA
jgi:serine protease